MAKKKKRTGRPTKLTDEAKAALLKAIATGCTPRDAASYAGVPFHRLQAWNRMGRVQNAREPYRSFHIAFSEAKRKTKVLVLGVLLEGSKTDWKAAAWYLERVWPEEFGRRDRVKLEGDKKRPLSIDATARIDPKSMDPEAIREAGELLARLAVKAKHAGEEAS